ncbi:50S ribosomal protein L15 [Candidatus Wolfebacteria bacterium]|nr:50S ribosomal protein L15 [Candidatus Wolfebacteria bacterium]
MQLHDLKSQFKKEDKKRVGRGGKRGTTSGRGTKGQKSRSGHRIRPAERDLIQRLPKLRGFQNKPLREKDLIVNVGDLEKKIKGNSIDREILIKSKIIRNFDKNKKIKILGNGDLNRSFEIRGLKISKNARKKIEAAGGKIN